MLKFPEAANRLNTALIYPLCVLAAIFVPGKVFAGLCATAVVLYLMPHWLEMCKMSGGQQQSYLKALVKSAKVQRVAIFAFSLWLINAINYWMRTWFWFDWARPDRLNLDLAWLTLPPIIYLALAGCSILLRQQIKPIRSDPELVNQRQLWTIVSYCLFTMALPLTIAAIVTYPNGPVDWLCSWLMYSAHQAGMQFHSRFEGFGPLVSTLPHFSPSARLEQVYALGADQSFYSITKMVTGLILSLALLQPAMRFANLLTSICWRITAPRSMSNIVEAVIEAIRLPGRSLKLKYAHPLFLNAARTFWWLTACYLALFWLFGFCGGPLGVAISGWMECCLRDADYWHLHLVSNGKDYHLLPQLRIFMASIVAMIGMVPLAVTGAVWLPYNKGLKIVINEDGISLPYGPYLAMQLRTHRLWSDLRELTVRKSRRCNDPRRSSLILTFRTGGRLVIRASQLSAADLGVLISSVDEHAIHCTISHDVIRLRDELLILDDQSIASDSKQDSRIKQFDARVFKSTAFSPLKAGDFLPDMETRIVLQLSSKPLCAVYLGRRPAGDLVIIKQFYLAGETEETRATAKIFEREFELLRKLDHPGLSKVVSSFGDKDCTYLVISHRRGVDLRSVVQEHGPRAQSTVIGWAKQLCQIMIYLHSRDPIVMHRDLTPDNIIVGDDGQVRIIDFGAAREFLEGITGTMIGKQCYMAPEQLRGEATPQSDIYSFGGTLNFLLTGHDPLALTESNPAKDSDCSPEFNQLIRDCTQFHSAARPASFADVLQRLNDLDSGTSVKLSLKVAAPESRR